MTSTTTVNGRSHANGAGAATKLRLEAGKARSQSPRVMLFLLANRSGLSEFDLRVLQGVETGCAHRGWHVEFASCRYGPATVLSDMSLPALLNGLCPDRAVILCGTNYANLPAMLQERGIPFSVLGNGMAEPVGPGGADTVFSDDVQGARDVTTHLIAQGHRDIFFVGDEQSPAYKRRACGYSAAMRGFGLEPLLSSGCSDDRAMGYQAIKSILSSGRNISAAVAGNGSIARGIFDVIEETPSAAIAVGGFSGGETAGRQQVAASVREFPDELGAVLADFAALRAENPAAPIQQFIVPTELVLRDSLYSFTTGETC